jgi:hypothetical protein
MQGHTVRRSNGAKRVGYQCVYRTEYPGDETHPRSLFLAEDRILPAVDGWLADLTSADRLEGTVRAILEADCHESTEPPEQRRAKLQASEARKKLGQYLDALEPGMDPTLIAERTRIAQGELTSAGAVIDAFGSSDSSELSGRLVHELLGTALESFCADAQFSSYRLPGSYARSAVGSGSPTCWRHDYLVT